MKVLLQLESLLDDAEKLAKSYKGGEAEELCVRVLDTLAEIEATPKRLKSSLEKKFNELKAKALLIGSESIVAKGQIHQALPYAEQAVAPAYHSANSELHLDTLLNLAIIQKNTAQFGGSLEYSNQVIAICDKHDYPLRRARAYGTIGNVYELQADFPRSLEYMHKALDVYYSINDKAGVAVNLGNIGYLHFEIADYPNALSYFERSLAIDEERGDILGIASNLDNIGKVYKETQDFTRALEYYARSLELFRQTERKDLVAMVTSSIGVVYTHLGNYDKAISHLKSSLSTHIETGKLHWQGSDLVNLGNVYGLKKNYVQALENFQKSLEISVKLQRMEGQAIATGNIAKLYAMEDFEHHSDAKAEEYMLKAIDLSKSIGIKTHEYGCHHALAQIYKRQKRWEQFAEHFERYHELEKEVEGESVKRKIEEFTISMAVKEKQREIEIHKLRSEQLEKEMKLQQRELANKTLQLVQQVEMIQNFRVEIEKVVRHADTAERAIRSIKLKLNELPENVLQWQKFESEFRSVHPEFEENLKQQFHDLSIAEMKVCCLLRIGMNTRDIATLLFLSERTVENHRFRIRKKMGIANSEDIVAYLSKFN